jgi:hypothetical protein
LKLWYDRWWIFRNLSYYAPAKDDKMPRSQFGWALPIVAVTCIVSLTTLVPAWDFNKPLLAAEPVITPAPKIRGTKASKAKRGNMQLAAAKATKKVPEAKAQPANSKLTNSKLGNFRPKTKIVLPTPLSAVEVADQVDQLILKDLKSAKVEPAPEASAEDFLRRVTFDIAGTAPEPERVKHFARDSDQAKRANAIDRLLASDDYARNWAQYWREVIYSRATDPRSRAVQSEFETWMRNALAANTSWDKITTSLLTATGNVQENGATALIFAHQGDAEEIASEASRIFLGIQIQCASCHDHPTDKWKREQFHQLAAFFPRITLRRDQGKGILAFTVSSLEERPGGNRPFAQPGAIAREPEKFIQLVDKNNDKKITLDEVKNPQFKRQITLVMERADTNKDGALTAMELKALPIPPMQGRGSLEHAMPNLDNPADPGRQMDPVFFVTGEKLASGLDDMERREAVAQLFTSPGNQWFAKAFVNRMWTEMLGEGFYSPVDDIGPERTANSPQVIDLLSRQFAAHRYDIKWLISTIANSKTYQRSVRAKLPTESSPTFASNVPTRLRADQLYEVLTSVLGVDELPAGRNRPRPGMGGRRVDNSPRGIFETIFGFDPSTPHDEVTGTIPQALFMMNNATVNQLTKASGKTRLAKILNEFPDDNEALGELYLLVLSRHPSAKELAICRDYLGHVNNRSEAYEDLMWSLLNSSEFQTKR